MTILASNTGSYSDSQLTTITITITIKIITLIFPIAN